MSDAVTERSELLPKHQVSHGHGEHENGAGGSSSVASSDLQNDRNKRSNQLRILGNDNTPSKNPGRRIWWGMVSLSFVTSLAVALLGVLIAFKATRGFWRGPRHITACDLDTSSNLKVAFQIDARILGDLSFSGAKAVSVVADFIFGQLGRLLLGFVAWHVFGDALTKILNSSPVSYELYTSVTLATVSVKSLWGYMKAVFKLRPGADRWIMAGFVYVTLWALFWPTIISASMGYVSNTVGYLNLTDGSLVDPASTKTRPCFSIPDGERVGLSDNVTIVANLPACLLPVNEWYEGLDTNDHGCGRDSSTPNVSISTEIEEYYRLSYSSYLDFHPGSNLANATGSWNASLHENNTLYINKTKFDASTPLLEVHYRRCFNGTQVRNWEASTSTSLSSSLWNCVQVNGYNWGLSTTMFLFTGSGMLLWVLCIFCLFVWGNKCSNSESGTIKRGRYRTIANIGEALRVDLGSNAGSYTEEELKSWLVNQI